METIQEWPNEVQADKREEMLSRIQEKCPRLREFVNENYEVLLHDGLRIVALANDSELLCEGDAVEVGPLDLFDPKYPAPLSPVDRQVRDLAIAGAFRRALEVRDRWQTPVASNDNADPAEGVTVPYGFVLDATGVYHVPPEDQSKWTKLAGPLAVVAHTRATDGRSWGLLLRWHDRDGRQHEWAVPLELLAGDGQDVRRELMDGGLFVTASKTGRNRLVEFLSKVEPHARATAVNRTGWHESAFVLPDGARGDAGELIVFQSEQPLPDFGQRGTLGQWQEQVASFAKGNPRLAFTLSAAFAGPLLGLTDTEGGGVHLRGGSSSGKTTAIRAATSVWGGPGFLRTWRTTSNGLESVATAHSETLLALDELGQVDCHEAGATAYMLAQGEGKSRANRAGLARRPNRWRVVFLSSGEIALEDKLREANKRVAAGQEVRVLDIPADAGCGLGIFEELAGFTDSAGLADHLRSAAGRCYGTAGPAFVERLTSDPETGKQHALDVIERFQAERVPDDADGQVARAGQRFGLIAAAGELAAHHGVLPWPEGEAFEAVGQMFDAWLDRRGSTEPAEVRQAVQQTLGFIERHGASRFQRIDQYGGATNETTIRDRAGFIRQTSDGHTEYLIFPTVFRDEVASGLDYRTVVNALHDRQLLRTYGAGRSTPQVRTPAGQKRLYVVCPQDGIDIGG